MNVVLDEFISSLQELSSQNDDRCGTISDLSILNLRKFTEDFGGWMGDLQLLKDGGSIIGDGNVTDVIDEHFIESLRTEGGLDDVSEGEDSSDVLGTDILALFSLTEDTDLGHICIFVCVFKID
jgi:hypothetical protein